MDTIDIPAVVAGRQREPGSGPHRLEYENDVAVRLYRPGDEDVELMVASGQTSRAADLQDLTVDDIVIFFDRVRQNWMNPENHWRRLAIEVGSRVTGYAQEIIDSDVNYLGHTLDRSKQYDFIETDIGDVGMLDEWRPSKAVMVRCWPQGVISHIMVGNVPLASLFTIYRSLVTKNITIAKLPSRDVISALCFANCICETEADHPVARALSTVYWEPGSDVENEILQRSNVITVWGRGSTVDAIKRRVPVNTDFIEFGPKRSLAIVRDDVADVEHTALGLAYDIAFYDQEACFSAQEVFAQAHATELAEALAGWLGRFSSKLPRRRLSLDQDAHIHRARMEAQAEGWTVLGPADTGWTVVVTDGPVRLPEHPLARFAYVHPVKDMADVVAMVDRDVQTVSVAPWAGIEELAADLTAAGADRIVGVGRMTRFRPGFIHDGFHPMRRMVRWTTIEREISYKYRFTTASPAEYERRLYALVTGDDGTTQADREPGGHR